MLDTAPASSSPVLDQLRQILGQDGVDQSEKTLALYSQDIWKTGKRAEVIASPKSIDDLARTVAAAHSHGHAVAIRGAGMSYTEGYIPTQDSAILLDMSKMDRILDISPDDMSVTVEAGCTWNALNEALKPHGLRAPFWGPLSGIQSTIGGAISHYNAIFGAGHYGTSAESVIGLSVVLADGSVLRTGARRVGKDARPAPYYRFYGPDLTGLFTGDCGAFGVKAEITLRLIRRPAHTDEASFAFDDYKSWIAAASEIARASVAAEMFGFDPRVAAQRMKRASVAQDVKTLGKVIKSGSSLMQGVKDAAKIAMAGRDFITRSDYTFHVFCEGRSQAGMAADMAEVRAIVERAGGREISNTIARVIRAEPFPPPNSVLGPNGERWVPVHGMVALSDAEAAFAALEATFAGMADDFAKYDIDYGYLITTLSTNVFLIEPVFYWPEAREPVHEALMDPAIMAKMPVSPPNPEATAAVGRARRAAIDTMQTFGSSHQQIGRTYPYLERMDAPTQALLHALKAQLDPERRLNTGGLGL